MSNIILGIVTILYLLESLHLIYNNQYGLSLAFLAYAIANVGLLLATRGF